MRYSSPHPNVPRAPSPAPSMSGPEATKGRIATVSIKLFRQHLRDDLASNVARRSRAFAQPSIGSTESEPGRTLRLTARDARMISSLLDRHAEDEIATEVC